MAMRSLLRGEDDDRPATAQRSTARLARTGSFPTYSARGPTS